MCWFKDGEFSHWVAIWKGFIPHSRWMRGNRDRIIIMLRKTGYLEQIWLHLELSIHTLEEPLVEWNKIIFRPLQIKLGLIYQFVKTLDKNEKFFKYICSLFSHLTIEQLKAKIFDLPKHQNKNYKDCYLLNIIFSWYYHEYGHQSPFSF